MKDDDPMPLVPPEKPTRMIPQRGPDEGYDWDRPDVMPTEPERPKRATFYPATGMTLVDADALPEDAPRCPRADCGVTLAFVPAGGCGEDGCPYEDETERQYVERLAS